MKKLLYVLAASGVLLSASCEKEALDTAPAGQLSSGTIFSDPHKAQSAVDGIYRLMYTLGWSANWAQENPGIATFTIIRSLMGEDHYMYQQGQGWFFFDYTFGVGSDWTSTSGRQYAQWNLFYTLISQANYVIDHEEFLAQSQEGQNVLGQAYAIRAYSYYCLYEDFCQGDYEANKTAPGVPIYTKGTDKETQGVGRGTIEGLFTQINADFQKSVDYFTEADMAQSHPSHIDIYAAYGLWARASLGQQNYTQAGTCAREALKKPNLTRVAQVSELSGFNNRYVSDVMWAFEVTADQTGPYGPFFSHMDPEGGYGKVAPQCIDTWLYEQMGENDTRRAWAEKVPVDDEGNYIYWQTKFRYSNIKTSMGDLINMRAEEMLLTLAECACRAGNETEAKALLRELYAQRDPARAEALDALTGAEVSLDTHAAPATLIDEILLQRRIELWCEGTGRVPDLRRLGLGYTRENQPNDSSMQPNDPDFILAIPLAEFNSNNALDLSTDQN